MSTSRTCTVHSGEVSRTWKDDLMVVIGNELEVLSLLGRGVWYNKFIQDESTGPGQNVPDSPGKDLARNPGSTSGRTGRFCKL